MCKKCSFNVYFTDPIFYCLWVGEKPTLTLHLKMMNTKYFLIVQCILAIALGEKTWQPNIMCV
jgi:hypothetical protein